MAKQWIELILVGFAGMFARWFYGEQGWRLSCLPNFLICGAVIMAFVEMGEQATWKRKVRGLQDAKWEQEAMIRESQNWR